MSVSLGGGFNSQDWFVMFLFFLKESDHGISSTHALGENPAEETPGLIWDKHTVGTTTAIYKTGAITTFLDRGGEEDKRLSHLPRPLSYSGVEPRSPQF